MIVDGTFDDIVNKFFKFFYFDVKSKRNGDVNKKYLSSFYVVSTTWSDL